MLKINTEELIESVIKRGMRQAHLNYEFTICKATKIPAALKKSIRENASNFFDGGSEVDYFILKVPEDRDEPSDATSKIAQLIKTNFLDGDPENTFTTSDVQVGYVELKTKKEKVEKIEKTSDDGDEEETEEKEEIEDKTTKRMFYVIKYKIIA